MRGSVISTVFLTEGAVSENHKKTEKSTKTPLMFILIQILSHMSATMM